MPSVSIIGPGRLGSALALALARAGYDVQQLVFRRSPPGDRLLAGFNIKPGVLDFASVATIASDIVLITTQDTEIRSVAESIAGKTSAVVLHTSGSLSSDILESLRLSGCEIGSLHPLLSISDPEAGAEMFSGAYFCIEGDEKARIAAGRIARDLGGKTLSIPTASKPLYHAAAVMCSGHLVALIDVARYVLERSGVDSADSASVLAPLISSTIDNLRSQSTAEALTGPFARLDRPAFRRHLDSLTALADENVLDIYLDLALHSLDIMRGSHRNSVEATDFREEVYIAKKNRRVIK
jgi:predicted short-subunit dehydrogenase-like oxidoreductase (DUF2520 family)